MSRSRRKTPIFGIACAKSEKDDKRFWHKRFRQATRLWLHAGKENMPHFRDVSNVWAMAKDGRRYFQLSPGFWKPLWKILMK